MSKIDTSLAVINPFLREVEGLDEERNRELRLRVAQLKDLEHLEIQLNGDTIRLTIGRRDLGKGEEHYYAVGKNKRGYTNVYRFARDFLVYEKLGSQFVDSLLRELRKIEYPN